MRIVTLNLNGVRASLGKGLLSYLERTGADIVCFQEVRAHEAKIPPLAFPYRCHWHPAEWPGYSGVGILSRREADEVHVGLGHPVFDCEGRVLRADFGRLSVVSVYVPSGGRDLGRLDFKLNFLSEFRTYLARLFTERELVVCGDFNIAHREIDLANPRQNRKMSGCLPEERAYLDSLLALGLRDVYRDLVGERPGHYSWWSTRAGVRGRNIGWRLDYQLATPGLAKLAVRGRIDKTPLLSDHAPVVVDYAV